MGELTAASDIKVGDNIKWKSDISERWYVGTVINIERGHVCYLSLARNVEYKVSYSKVFKISDEEWFRIQLEI